MIDIENKERERTILVAVNKPHSTREEVEDHLNELELLAETAGAETILKMIQDRGRFDPAYFIGRGKAEELAELVELNDVNLVIFDDDLNPTQVRNLEQMIDKKILDRSGLILDIFALHAKTNEAKTQVELAQLQYLLPRLTRAWTHLSKQYGGIGTKGPGETQIETDRRIIRTRIAKLKEKLKKIDSRQITKSLKRKEFLKASLVGYTNAGKSTLLNLLTGASVISEDKLFATLDSTTRSFDLDKNKKIMISDTVGFIRKLPHDLVASFRSTLKVVTDADLILHVIDICHPEFEEHMHVTEKTLKDLNCHKKPQIKIFNKVDLLEDKAKLNLIMNKYKNSIAVSALRGFNIGKLNQMLLDEIEKAFITQTLTFKAKNSRLVSYIHETADVTDCKYEDDTVNLSFRTSKTQLNKILRMYDEIKETLR